MNKLLTTLVLSCAVSSAYAGNISYNYIEGGIATNDVDGVDNSLFLNGSYGVTPNVYIIGGFTSTGIDTNTNIDADISAISIGGGYHKSMAEKTDVYGDISYVDFDLDLSQGSASASVSIGDGFQTRIGARHQVSDKIEAEANITHLKIEDFSDTFVTVTGRYLFTDKVSASLGFSTADDAGVVGAIRYNF